MGVVHVVSYLTRELDVLEASRTRESSPKGQSTQIDTRQRAAAVEKSGQRKVDETGARSVDTLVSGQHEH
jgi:hypothetical protein